jgi:hypothetical protein
MVVLGEQQTKGFIQNSASTSVGLRSAKRIQIAVYFQMVHPLLVKVIGLLL